MEDRIQNPPGAFLEPPLFQHFTGWFLVGNGGNGLWVMGTMGTTIFKGLSEGSIPPFPTKNQGGKAPFQNQRNPPWPSPVLSPFFPLQKQSFKHLYTP